MLVGEADYKPWGHYTVLADEPNHKVKRIQVKPGQRLSLQRHVHRSEHWLAISGEAIITREEEEIRLTPGGAVSIPQMCWHRIHNSGKEPFLFIEIQRGSYFGEDDIERKEDDYGRT